MRHCKSPSGSQSWHLTGATLLCLTLIFINAAALQAQTFAELVQHGHAGDPILLAAEGTTGRADVSGELVLVGPPGAAARLTAPEDDAILVVLPDATVSITDAVFVHSGVTRFGVYVDGGALTLERCAFEGAFENAVYIASGSVTLKDCVISDATIGLLAGGGAVVQAEDLVISDAGDIGIFADAASLDLIRTRVENAARTGITVQSGSVLTLADSAIVSASETGLLAIGAATVSASGMSLEGAGGRAMIFQEVAETRLERLRIAPGWAHGLTVQGGGTLLLEGFALHGATGALSVSTMTGPVRLSHGRLSAETSGQVAVLVDAAGINADDVEIVGGEVGLYLTGAVSGARISSILAHGQSNVGLYVDEALDPTGAAAPRFDDICAIAHGEALPMALRASPGITVAGSAFLAAGPMAFSSDTSPGMRLADNFFAASPAPGLETQPRLLQIDGEARPRFLDDGVALPVDWDQAPEGNAGLSTAALAAAPGLPEELRRAVADFSLGLPSAPGALRLALDYARPVALPAPTEPAHEVSLAPPEPGWVWDASAARIGLSGPGGLNFDLTPGDFPLALAPGLYAVSLDGRPAGRLDVSGPSALTLALPLAPFFAWRAADGTLVRGPALYLRPKAELAALLDGMRPLLPGEFWGRAGLFAPRRGADRAAAAAFLAEARATIPDRLGRMAELQAAKIWSQFDRNWQTVNIAFGLFAVFGSTEDADWLAGLAVPPGISIDNLETAALIETRLGRLTGGVALATARARMAELAAADANSRRALGRLLVTLARLGSSEAIGLLAEYRRESMSIETSPSPDPTGVIELSRQDRDHAGGMPSAYLDRLQAAHALFLAGNFPQNVDRPTNISLWIAAAAALAHEVVHGDPSAPLRRLPVPPGAGAAFGWLLADPVTGIAGRFGKFGPPEGVNLHGWTGGVGSSICPALALRPAGERGSIVARSRAEIVTAVLDHGFAEAANPGSPDHMDRIRDINLSLDFGLGDCVLTRPVIDPFGRDAQGEETSFFNQLDYEPLWWVRRPRVETVMANFGRGEDALPAFAGLSPYPTEVLTAALGPDHRADPDLLAALLARHRLATDAFHNPLAAFTFGSERRQFRLRNEDGNGTVVIAGYLDIRPLPDGERLIVAIRHDILSRDYGGLAAMITAPDRAPWEGEQRLRMFETVTLDRGGVETAMSHAGSSAAGVHFFTAPWNGRLDDQTLHLGMRFWDATWEIAVPLWASALAHDLRLAAGEAVP